MSDPLAQAMVLTAIVITLGVAAFLLALAYRSWYTHRRGRGRRGHRGPLGPPPPGRGEHVDEDELDTTGCEQTSDTDDDRAGGPPAQISGAGSGAAVVNPGTGLVESLLPLPVLVPLLGAGADPRCCAGRPDRAARRLGRRPAGRRR